MIIRSMVNKSQSQSVARVGGVCAVACVRGQCGAQVVVLAVLWWCWELGVFGMLVSYGFSCLTKLEKKYHL